MILTQENTNSSKLVILALGIIKLNSKSGSVFMLIEMPKK